jgi:hypothetical protein
MRTIALVVAAAVAAGSAATVIGQGQLVHTVAIQVQHRNTNMVLRRDVEFPAPDLAAAANGDVTCQKSSSCQLIGGPNALCSKEKTCQCKPGYFFDAEANPPCIKLTQKACDKDCQEEYGPQAFCPDLKNDPNTCMCKPDKSGLIYVFFDGKGKCRPLTLGMLALARI